MKEFIEIPFGAKDSELCGWEYTIPEGFVASIENGKIVVKKEEDYEDERIRKKLIEAVKGDMIVGGTKDKQRAIAWLEKQGDMDRRIQEEIEKQTKQQWKVEKQRDNISGECNDTALEKQLKIWFEKGKCSGIDDVIFHPQKYGLEKQGEQKPLKVYRVENEAEEKGLWRKFDGTWQPLFDMLTDGKCKDMPMEDNPIYREGGKRWFASAPSKKALREWFSKRDLEELVSKDFTITEFEVTEYKKVSDFEYIFTRDSIINKSYLEVSDIYSEQKPAAWSEDDEEELDNIIDFLNSPSTAELCPTLRSNAIDWLKSLKPQPQWKPSDEQIQALEYQVNSTYIGSWQYKASKELLEQLKKL